MSISGLGLGFRMRLRAWKTHRNRCKYRGFRAVTDISVLRPAYAPISHACLEAGAADAHDARPGGGARVRIIEASFLFGDPGGRASAASVAPERFPGGRISKDAGITP